MMLNLMYDADEVIYITQGEGASFIWEGMVSVLATVHGDENGCMFVVNDGEAIEVDPAMFRIRIDEQLFEKSRGKPVKAVCCYPKEVMERYKDELKAAKITVVGDWSEPTRVRSEGDMLLCVYTETEFNALTNK